MHPNTGDIWYAKSGDNVRNYHSKRKAPNTRQKKRYPRLRLLSLQIKQLAKGHKKSKASPKTPPTGTIWATKRKNAAHIILWATKNFMALEPYGPRNGKTRPILSYGRRKFSWPIRGHWTSLFFRRPIFGLRVSDVENIFAAHCLGRRKCMIGRRYPPWPKTLFLVVISCPFFGLANHWF